MKISQPLHTGRLIKRYKRFLADIRMKDGEIVTAHCPNSGSMLSCNIPGSDVLLSHHSNPNRKYPYTWEMVKVNSVWVGINTMVPNRLVYEAVMAGEIPELTGYDEILREKKVSDNSRLDLMLKNSKEACYVEIKNVTLVENNTAFFPDAVTTRGAKHLRELMHLKKKGNRSVIFFLVQRGDGEIFAPADKIDKVYGDTLRLAIEAGVEILPYRAVVTPNEIKIDKKIPYDLGV